MNFLNNLSTQLSQVGLTLSDIISIVLSILTIFISIVAVCISVISIRKTEKSIYESNRPMVTVYLDYLQVYNSVHEYLVIKNFGKTVAEITKIDFRDKIPVTPYDNTPLLEEYGIPFTLAPGQSLSTNLRTNAFNKEKSNGYFGEVKIEISYKDNLKSFKEIYVLNQDVADNLRLTKSNGSKKTSISEAILHATEEMLRRDL